MISRRLFLNDLLVASATAPSIVKAESVMRVVVPKDKHIIICYPETFNTLFNPLDPDGKAMKRRMTIAPIAYCQMHYEQALGRIKRKTACLT